jgi:hypothetical protein
MATFEEELNRRLDRTPAAPAAAPTPSTTTTNAVAMDSFKDEMRGLFAQSHSQSNVNAPPAGLSATPSMGYTQLYGRKDEAGQLVPIDINAGFDAPYWDIARQSDPQAKADLLQKRYPDRKVRLLDTGDVTIDVQDSDGKVRDVVLNPEGIDEKDFLDVAAQTPEIAASMLTSIAMGPAQGIVKTALQIAASALAGGAAGAGRDVIERSLRGIPVRGGDILQGRGAQVALDLFGEGALATAGNAFRIASPFAREAKPDSLAFNLRQGVDYLRNNFEADLPVTAGERSGSMQDIQRIATGNLTSEEKIGADAFDEIKNRVVAPLEDAFTRARTIAQARGDDRIEQLINDVIGRAPQRVTPAQGGEVARKAFERQITRAEGAVGKAYADVEALPGGTGEVLSGDAAARAAREIREELPAVIKDFEVDTGLKDFTGAPITKTVEQRTELASGKPEGLEKALSDLESLRGGRVSLKTLTNMKRAAYDSIAAFKTAHGDVKDRWFTKIASAYERAIQESIDATSNIDLKNALATARDTYKREMLPLEKVGVRELAKEDVHAGVLSGEQILNRFFEGEKAVQNYQLLEDALGPNNVALRALKRAWVDSKIAVATDKVTGTIDPEKLYASLESLDNMRPELANKVFGKNYQPILSAIRIRGAIEKAGLKNIDDAELRVMLSLPDPTVADLKEVLRMSQRRQSAYVNKFFNDVQEGVPLNNFNPTTFVTSLRNTEVPTEQVKSALAALDPKTRDAIATAEFYRILSEASTTEGSTLAKEMRGDPLNLSPSGLVKALGKRGAERERTLLLLGDGPTPGAPPPRPGEPTPTRADTLMALVKALAPKEAASTVFSGLGNISAANAVREATRGPLKYAMGFPKNMLLATAYVNGLGKVLTNTQFDREATAVAINTLIAAEPFLRASIEAFGEENTKGMVADVKASVDQWIGDVRESVSGRRRAAVEQFMGGQPVPMQIQPQQ